MTPVRVVVAGGSGRLGGQVVDALRRTDGVVPRVVSRGRSRSPSADGVEHAVADIDAGVGLAEALAGGGVLVHLTHAGPDETRRLLAAAIAAGLSRVVYVSIVGADRIPLPYYAAKVGSERAVRDAGIPATIVRATQFHSFVDDYLATLAALPLPGLFPAAAIFQTIDEREVAELVARVALEPSPPDRVEIAGPDRLTLGEMAEAWFAARSMPRRFLPGVPTAARGYAAEAWAGGVMAGFLRGDNTPSGPHERGRRTWAQHLGVVSPPAG